MYGKENVLGFCLVLLLVTAFQLLIDLLGGYGPRDPRSPSSPVLERRDPPLTVYTVHSSPKGPSGLR